MAYLVNIIAENDFYYVQLPDDLAKQYDLPDDAFTIGKDYVSAFGDYDLVSQVVAYLP